MKYQDAQFNTGDIILFSSRDSYSSCKNCLLSILTDCIRCCTKSEFTYKTNNYI